LKDKDSCVSFVIILLNKNPGARDPGLATTACTKTDY